MKYWRLSWSTWVIVFVSYFTLFQVVATLPSHKGSNLLASLTTTRLNNETLVGVPSTMASEEFFAQEVRTTQFLQTIGYLFSSLGLVKSRAQNATTVLASLCLWRFLMLRKVSSPSSDPFPTSPPYLITPSVLFGASR